MILSSLKNEYVTKFSKTHKIREKLKNIRLVLIGNQLGGELLEGFEEYLKNSNVEIFGLNLYANNIGHTGAKILADGVKGLKAKDLDIDLYFNNVTEVGTKYITDAVGSLDTLQKLTLNLDFNYIKN